MIRWSPTSRVFSIDPEGITRACPTAPLINKNARPTQNHATISRRTCTDIGIFGCAILFSLIANSLPKTIFGLRYVHDWNTVCIRTILPDPRPVRTNTRHAGQPGATSANKAGHSGRSSGTDYAGPGR